MAWLATLLAELAAKLLPLVLGFFERWAAKHSHEAQQDHVGEAIQKGDTLEAEKALNSPVAGVPSGLPGAGIRDRPPVVPGDGTGTPPSA